VISVRLTSSAAVLSLAASVLAAPSGPVLAVAAAGGGQQGLVVGFDEKGQLEAGICASEPCSLAGATAIPTPPEAAAGASAARLRVVRLGMDRKAIIVEVPDQKAERTWTVIVAAPLAGAAAKPLVVFNDYTGLTTGIEGERHGPMVYARGEGVYVGEQQEGRDLCGRPAILSPTVLDPSTLTLKAAKLQRLPESERDAAPRLTAQPSQAAPPPRLLHAEWASSAAAGASSGALTDGKIETAWAENRGGAGRGEFAVLRAPREVPIAAFDFVLPDAGAPHASVPREIYVATDHELFQVTFPPESAKGGSHYTVPLPAPVKSSCVAIVLDHASSEDKGAQVSIAEVWARPALPATVDELVHTLRDGGPTAEAAGAVLRAQGTDAFAAVASAFSTLDESGRRIALDVLDDAPCDVALPAYIEALVGTSEALRAHARGALGRCGSSAGAAFVTALERAATPPARVAIAIELANVSPALAVQTLVPRLSQAGAAERRAYRDAVAHAAESPEGHAAVGAALDDDRLDPRASTELLRALGEALTSYGPSASRAFARAAASDASFRNRFLLLGPAAVLSGSDGAARAFLASKLSSDPAPEIRAEAARAVRDPRAFATELSRALDDPAVRVREAAAVALGAGPVEPAAARVEQRLSHDAWPLVRAAAAGALAGFGPSPRTDQVLGAALEDDDAIDVRRAATLSLGARRATTQTDRIRERLDDTKEAPAVRAAAAHALGLLCARDATDRLTEHARRLPMSDEGERQIGEEAVFALSALHPPDLAVRLSPLLAKDVPPPVRKLAQSALAARGACAAPGKTH
jgi:HEAT repeat protein